jgi:hypothetical protein
LVAQTNQPTNPKKKGCYCSPMACSKNNKCVNHECCCKLGFFQLSILFAIVASTRKRAFNEHLITIKFITKEMGGEVLLSTKMTMSFINLKILFGAKKI